MSGWICLAFRVFLFIFICQSSDAGFRFLISDSSNCHWQCCHVCCVLLLPLLAAHWLLPRPILSLFEVMPGQRSHFARTATFRKCSHHRKLLQDFLFMWLRMNVKPMRRSLATCRLFCAQGRLELQAMSWKPATMFSPLSQQVCWYCGNWLFYTHRWLWRLLSVLLIASCLPAGATTFLTVMDDNIAQPRLASGKFKLSFFQWLRWAHTNLHMRAGGPYLFSANKSSNPLGNHAADYAQPAEGLLLCWSMRAVMLYFKRF